ncbi:MAG: D-glucuronyl C5-epimerase family protein [Ferruginibacter sp.]
MAPEHRYTFSMGDFFQKLKLYWKSNPGYWKLADTDKRSKYAIGYYPLSFRDRLYQGHYVDFDEIGLPMFHSKAGSLVHFCTGMCSFAFAHWEEFLNTGRKEHADHVIKVADYLLGMAEERENGSLMVLDYDSDEKDGGTPCAMNQGESISSLARAYCITSNAVYKNAALKMAIPFGYPYGHNGVTGNLKNGTAWYLEGGSMILNGHNYALFGLADLFSISSEAWVKSHLDAGIYSLINSIEYFDNGFWSWYWLNEPLYIASAMYHNLHVCQLKAMAHISNSEKLALYASRFEKYAQSPLKRARAAAYMVNAKIKKKAG